ncbi:MAG: serpin family protein [Opitutaceae bacterium]
MTPKAAGILLGLAIAAAAVPGTLRAASADLDFSVGLFHGVAAGAESFALSPYSARETLQMAEVGARGETADELRRAAGAPGSGRIASAHSSLDGPPLGTNATLVVSNSAWVDRRFTLLPGYVDALDRLFRAEADTVDFGRGAAAAERINAWIDERSAGHLQGAITPKMLGVPALVLTDAVYFQADWQHPFDAGRTHVDAFYPMSGLRSSVRTMHQVGPFALIERPGVRLLEMPYRGGTWSLVLLLPEGIDGWRELSRQMDPATLDGWLAALAKAAPREVNVALPAFRQRWSGDLVPALRKLGIERLFDPRRADLSGIAPQPGLRVCSVVQETYVRMDEKGTEAAGMTFSGFAALARPAFQASFRVDHPFLYLILDRRSGQVLFLGRMLDPTTESP